MILLCNIILVSIGFILAIFLLYLIFLTLEIFDAKNYLCIPNIKLSFDTFIFYYTENPELFDLHSFNALIYPAHSSVAIGDIIFSYTDSIRYYNWKRRIDRKIEIKKQLNSLINLKNLLNIK